MLEIADANELIETVWGSLDCKVQIPSEWTDFFERTGRVPGQLDDRRRFTRYYMASRAVLEMHDIYHCVYTKDLSRTGVGFLYHDQIFPCQRIRLWMPNRTNPQLEIRRCRRIQDNCYEYGAVFFDD